MWGSNQIGKVDRNDAKGAAWIFTVRGTMADQNIVVKMMAAIKVGVGVIARVMACVYVRVWWIDKDGNYEMSGICADERIGEDKDQEILSGPMSDWDDGPKFVPV